MTCKRIPLRDDDESVHLDTYICTYDGDMTTIRPRDAVIVLPGGGYSFLSEREAEPIARQFLAAGCNAFILYYSLNENAKFPRPLVDVSRAICHVREHAEEYHIDPDRIFLCGSSAGGHLSAAIGSLWHEDYAKAYPEMPYGMNRPNGTILCYPLISLVEPKTKATLDCICKLIAGVGEDAPFWENACSIERMVSDKTAPAFLWQTQTDNCVPIENALVYMEAMLRHGVPLELHMYPFGRHGLSIARYETSHGYEENVDAHIATWMDLALEWMKLV